MKGLVIQVRGTSGSGKSTAVRGYLTGRLWQARYVAGRKKPLYYESADDNGSPVTILGHYESQCGGCDTIGSARAVYDLICALPSSPGCVVLCEGLLLSEDVKWTVELVRDYDVHCLFLTTPLKQCLEWVSVRRAAGGNDKPLNPANTANRVRTIERARVKLSGAGVVCRRCAARQAPGVILNWLRLHAQSEVNHGSGELVQRFE